MHPQKNTKSLFSSTINHFVACATSLVFLLLAAPAFGQNPPKVTVNPSFAPPQSEVLVSGKNFTPHTGFQITLDGLFIGEGVTNGTGSFSKATARIPSGVTEGDHQFTVTDLAGVTLSFPYIIRTDWTHRRSDIFNDANNPYEWKLSTTNVSGLTLAWNTIGNPGPCLNTTAIVVAGVVYYLNQNVGLQALDPATGAPLWNYDMSGVHNNPCGSTPSARDSLLFSLADIYVGADKELWSINIEKRTKNWVKKFDAVGWPLVADSVIVSDGSNLASFQTGGKQNYNNSAESDGYNVWSNGFVFSAVNPGNGFDYFRSYDATTGGVNWTQADVGCVDGNAPLAANGNIYKGCGGRLDSFNVSSSSYISNPNVEPFTNLAFANNMVYAGFYQGETAFIGAFDPNTLGVLWQAGLGQSAFGDPIVANGVLYTSIQFGSCSQQSSEAFVLAMDASSGNTLWSYQIPNACSAPVPAAVVDGTLYVVDNTGQALWAFR